MAIRTATMRFRGGTASIFAASIDQVKARLRKPGFTAKDGPTITHHSPLARGPGKRCWDSLKPDSGTTRRHQITDDFVSAGGISGAKSIPISRLKVGRPALFIRLKENARRPTGQPRATKGSALTCLLYLESVASLRVRAAALFTFRAALRFALTFLCPRFC